MELPVLALSDVQLFCPIETAVCDPATLPPCPSCGFSWETPTVQQLPTVELEQKKPKRDDDSQALSGLALSSTVDAREDDSTLSPCSSTTSLAAMAMEIPLEPDEVELLQEYVAHKWSPETPSPTLAPMPPMTGEVLDPIPFCVPVYYPEAPMEKYALFTLSDDEDLPDY